MPRLSCLLIVFVVSGLAGCGQKGALYLPTQPQSELPAAAADPAARSAAPTPMQAPAPAEPNAVAPAAEQGDQHAA